jgi:hypothetical protein
MEDLEKSIKGLKNTLDRAKKLVNRIMNENSGWISFSQVNKKTPETSLCHFSLRKVIMDEITE